MNCVARSLLLALTTVSTSSFAQTLISQHQDSSGKVTIGVFEENSSVAYEHYISVDVPEPWVVVGGGFETRVGLPYQQGMPTPYSAESKHLVVVSRPNASLSAWHVAAKAHYYYNFAPAMAWAVAMKIEGLTRSELLSKIVVSSADSPVVAHPNVAVGVPAGYIQIGGGFNVICGGNCNYGTASYPDTPYTWRAKSKDHIVSNPASLRVLAIGLQEQIEGIGSVAVMTTSASSASAQHPTGFTAMTPGYALTGCGAWVQWSGQGNLLTKIKPATTGGVYGCESASKDLYYASPAVITTYATGITVY